MVNLIVFPHCPKTGGTTLKERYKHHNEEFFVVDETPHVKDYTKVIFGHSAKIGFWEKDFLHKNIIYMTCMRDPVKRMMSMYNFFKTQLFYFRPGTPDVDFYLWYINKDVLRPMLASKQYEYYMWQHVNHKQWALDTTPLHNMYRNSILKWDVTLDKTSVDAGKLADCKAVNTEIQSHNMEMTWKHVMKHFDHVFFQDTNIVKTFDELLNKYELEMTPWEEMTITNETKYDLNKNNLSYVTFEDLEEDLQTMVLEDLKQDIEFYNRCKDKWKR